MTRIVDQASYAGLNYNPYKMRATMGSTQSVASTSLWVLLNFDTATYDTSNGFSSTAHTFTAPIAGYYVVSLAVDFVKTGAPAATNEYWWATGFFVNGTLQTQQVQAVTWPSAGIALAEYGTALSDQFRMNSGDVLDARFNNSWNAAITVQTLVAGTFWAIHLISV